MNSDLAASMRAAAQLTREGKLGEATCVIQAVLTGHDSAEARSQPARSKRNPAKGARQGSALPARGKAAEPTKPTERPARSLGEIVRIVRQGKRTGLIPDDGKAGIRKSPAVPEGAQFLSRSYACAAGLRTYKLYVPRRQAQQRALVVMLHGCQQTPDDFALGTRMNALAEAQGLLVAYPYQPGTANPSSCWNWFNPRDQFRGAGEPAIIAGLTREIVAEFDVDPARVFVAGLSAGGAMAAVMGETYPDIYAAVGIHSGLPYGSAHDVVSAFAAMRGEEPRIAGRRPRSLGAAATAEGASVRTIVFHGDADTVVHAANATRIIEAQTRPGEADRSTEKRSSAGGRHYVRRVIQTAEGSTLGEHWLIAGGGHAWSGGSPDGSFADPNGPDASREMLRFFLAGSRKR